MTDIARKAAERLSGVDNQKFPGDLDANEEIIQQAINAALQQHTLRLDNASIEMTKPLVDALKEIARFPKDDVYVLRVAKDALANFRGQPNDD